MAKIVTINNEIMSVHEDKVELGESYKGFTISWAQGSATEVIKAIKEAVPPVKMVFRSKIAGAWTFEAPEQAEAWPDGEDHKIITERPAHLYRIKAGADIKSIEDLKANTEYNLDGGKNEEKVTAEAK